MLRRYVLYCAAFKAISNYENEPNSLRTRAFLLEFHKICAFCMLYVNLPDDDRWTNFPFEMLKFDAA